MLKKQVRKLIVGSTLEDNVYTVEGKTLLLKKGITLTDDHISGLQSRGIDTVRIATSKSTNSAPIPQSPDAVRNANVPFTYPKSLEDSLFLQYDGKPILKLDDPAVKQTKQEAIKTAHKILDKVSQSRTLATSEAIDTAREIMNAITVNHQAFINIASVKEYDEYTFEHSVDVATYTTIIAKECGTPTKELSSICTGALLHDVGKMLVDQAILNKPGRLSDDEFEIIKTHSRKGYEILIENQVDEQIAVIAHGHHEHCDGGGYPKGLLEEKMPESAQMCAIADVYDALTADRVYRKAMDVCSAMKIILSESGKQFNSRFLSIFQRTIGIYPIGSVVKLNNGCTARVLDQNEGIVRPVIQLLSDSDENELEDKAVINLMDNKEFYVIDCMETPPVR
jgi:putative nucleotidyltransferase with HDIG domain